MSERQPRKAKENLFIRFRNRIRRFLTQGYYDYSLIFLVVCLCLFGIMMVYSTTSYSDIQLGRSEWYSTLKQFRYLIICLVGMLLLSMVNYHLYGKVVFIGIYVILLALFIALMVRGTTANASQRWLNLGPFYIQPSELAKPGIIVMLASFLNSKYGVMMRKQRNQKRAIHVKEENKKRERAGMPKLRVKEEAMEYGMLGRLSRNNLFFVGGFLLMSPFLILIVSENLSTAIIVFLIIFGMFFIVSDKKKIFAFLVAAMILLIVIVVLRIRETGSFPLIKDYQASRIKMWLDPESDPAGNGYQILQGLYTIGSGGLFGRGLGSSVQKLGLLPEAQNDMVFCIICEELGLFGAALVLFVFVLLLWRILFIIRNAPDFHGFLLAVGIFLHFSFQILMNIAVTTNMMPNTGVILPFISNGGSALMASMAEIGILLNISRKIRIKQLDRELRAVEEAGEEPGEGQ
ncbi:MAG: FtsW/RodA/SpoVE family cell cycle protein [Lachnospiraceae bacterium]|nr:FtsW/RodA/SpoVE family cell cycle protein [Lachnospiraceae bacterium]